MWIVFFAGCTENERVYSRVPGQQQFLTINGQVCADRTTDNVYSACL